VDVHFGTSTAVTRLPPHRAGRYSFKGKSPQVFPAYFIFAHIHLRKPLQEVIHPKTHPQQTHLTTKILRLGILKKKMHLW